MKRLTTFLAALVLLSSLWPTVTVAQQQTFSPNTVYGRLGIGPGPGQQIPFATLGAYLLGGNPITIASINGGSAPNSSLTLQTTTNANPSGDIMSLNGSFIEFHTVPDYNANNEAYFGAGTGPNGVGGNLTFSRQNGPATSPTAILSGDELSFIQTYGWDGTQSAPTTTPLAIVFGATENWTSTHHGSVIFFQTVINGTAQATNEFAVGNGVSALASGDPGETQGAGQGTFNARNANGYYIAGAEILNTNGNYTFLNPPATQSGAGVLVGNSIDPEIFLRGVDIQFQTVGAAAYLEVSASEVQPLPTATVALGDSTHKFTNGFFNGSVSAVGGFISNGNTGLTQTCTVNQAKTLIFTLGILTGGTCNS